MTLELNEVVRTGRPSIDRRGLLFDHGGRLFRAFQGEAAALYDALLEEPWLPELFEAGLVRFWRSDLMVQDYDFVVEVQRLPVVSYPPEWPTAVLREAGLAIARLGRALAPQGLGFVDAHPWNILFEGTRPVFVDLGSIVPSTRVSRAWAAEFRRHIVLPLELHRIGMHQLGDAVQRTQRGGWTARLERSVLRAYPMRYRLLYRSLGHPAQFYGDLDRYLQSLPAVAGRTPWSSYYPTDEPRVGEVERYTDKHRSVSAMLDYIGPGRVLDVGANEGWYSRLAVSKGSSVTALDIDDRALGRLFQSARVEGLPILPLRVDILWPPGTSGLALEYGSAPERLRARTVMLLAVLHHMLGSQGVTFAVVARVLSMFSERYAIVEFIPGTDEHLREWPLASDRGYTVGKFEAAMAPYFRLVQRLPSAPAPRELLLFEKLLTD